MYFFHQALATPTALSMMNAVRWSGVMHPYNDYAPDQTGEIVGLRDFAPHHAPNLFETPEGVRRAAYLHAFLSICSFRAPYGAEHALMSPVGDRSHFPGSASPWHRGWDYRASPGTPVLAPVDGYITRAYPDAARSSRDGGVTMVARSGPLPGAIINMHHIKPTREFAAAPLGTTDRDRFVKAGDVVGSIARYDIKVGGKTYDVAHLHLGVRFPYTKGSEIPPQFTSFPAFTVSPQLRGISGYYLYGWDGIRFLPPRWWANHLLLAEAAYSPLGLASLAAHTIVINDTAASGPEKIIRDETIALMSRTYVDKGGGTGALKNEQIKLLLEKGPPKELFRMGAGLSGNAGLSISAMVQPPGTAWAQRHLQGRDPSRFSTFVLNVCFIPLMAAAGSFTTGLVPTRDASGAIIKTDEPFVLTPPWMSALEDASDAQRAASGRSDVDAILQALDAHYKATLNKPLPAIPDPTESELSRENVTHQSGDVFGLPRY